MKNIILIFSIVCLNMQANATHIVGGSLVYEHLGDSTYKVSIRLYKDCSPQSINFSTSLRLEIRMGDGTLPATSFVRLPLILRDTLDPYIDTCAFNPGVCVELGVYSKVITLPSQSGGYHLFYTDCCRNGSVANINSPLTYGEGLHTFVPDKVIYPTNSSPVFNSYPPVYVCKDQDLNYDFSATDVDGDSLSYTLITPYHGLNEYSGPPHNSGVPYASLLPTISSTGTAPDNITFNTVSYLPGFSATNPLNSISGNGLTLSSTGLLTGIPEMVGQYLVAVRVDEYRNGVKIGTIVRDFQYNVLDCPPPKNAAIGNIDVCSGLSIQMKNESGAGANGFWWDFGTGNPADTSDLEEPIFTFPSNGIYNLTLMAQKGTLCADTAHLQIKISNVTGQFISDDTLCVGETSDFISNSFASSNDLIAYTAWRFNNVDLDTGTIVNHSFSQTGDLAVEMILASDNGCRDTVIKTVHVNSVPLPDFSPTIICNSQNVQFSNLSSSHADSFFWSFGTGQLSDSSILESANFTFPNYGTFPVTLITQKGTQCADTIAKDVSLHQITADFVSSDTICGEEIISFQDASSSDGTNINSWQWDFGDMSSSLLQNDNHDYDMPGTYHVKLVASTLSGCTDTIVKIVEVLALPSVIGGVDTALCVSSPTISLTATSQNSAGIVWEGNGGNFNPNNASYTVDYTASTGELNSGQTFVVVKSAMNPHCPIITDTIKIDIIETPDVSVVSDFTVCEDQSLISINGSVSNGSQILWSSLGTGSIANSALLSTTYDPSEADKLSGSVDLVLSSVNAYGCETNNDTLTITFAPIPHVSIVGSDTICYLDSIVITGTSNTGGGIWSSLGDGYFSPSSSDLTTTYFSGQADSDFGFATLIFSSSNNNGCTADEDTIMVTVLPLPEVDFQVLSACINTPTELTDQSSFVEQIVQWEWGIEDSLYSIRNPRHLFSDTGYFDVNLSITTSSGCAHSISAPIKVNDLPKADFIVPEPCIYGAVFIDESYADSTEIVSWLWHFDDGDSSNVQDPIHQYDTLGDYNVKLIVESGFGCIDSVVNQISIYPQPVSLFTFFPNPAKVNDVISFNSQSYSDNAPIVEWNWNFDNGDTSDLIKPQSSYNSGGAYAVSLIVFDELGCRDTSIQEVFITHGPQVPAAFSPGGDGVNDYLMILGTGFEEIDFRIYNNWGGLLFQTNDINDKGWDGTFNGEPQPLGVYIYTAWVKNIYGQEIEISGDVTIIK